MVVATRKKIFYTHLKCRKTLFQIQETVLCNWYAVPLKMYVFLIFTVTIQQLFPFYFIIHEETAKILLMFNVKVYLTPNL